MEKNPVFQICLAFLLIPFEAMAEPKPVEGNLDEGYLVFSSRDGNYQLKIDGRIMLDTGAVESDKNPVVANTEFRRARIAFKTMFDKKWAGEFDLDFAENEPELKDLWISYIAIPFANFKVGNHKPFFSMAEVTTSRWYTFMETPMVTDATGPGRRIGISASYYQTNYFVGASFFGDEIAVDNRDPAGDDSEPGKHEPYSYSTRAVYRPLVSEDVSRFIHLGVNYLKLQPQSDDGGRMRLRVRPESRVFDYRLLNTGKIADVDYQISQGIEIAGRINQLMFQSEYIDTKFIRGSASVGQDPSFSGYYVEAAYALSGLGRPYNLSDGEFGPVFPSGNHGDLEVSLRFSSFDLDDTSAGVTGGHSDNITLALNWYAHTNVVFRLNHTMAEMGENADGDGDFQGGDSISITGFRLQYLF